ncbi:MAG: glycoside hydrolase family 1 protein [Agathobacter sp.]|nr:glycoside hydrolase family 1 protein [Agathobacter sp.]
MSKFEQNFLIGAATAAHQVEGNNIHSDYWAMEHMQYTNFNEPSLDAVDHYNRYEEDIRMMAEAGLNAYRFSIEWARIEPVEGQFDDTEIVHYRKVLECCRENGIEPIVTMHHFTSPKWVIENGGWEANATVDAFAKYCKYVVEQLGDLMHYVVTINEANMGLQVKAIAERYKRQMMAKMQQMMAMQATQNTEAGNGSQSGNMEGVAQVGMNFNSMMENMKNQQAENVEVFGVAEPQTFVSARTEEGDMLVMRAHVAAKRVMKEVRPELAIGLSLSLHDIQPVEGGEEVAAKEWIEEFTHYIPYIKEDDFFGLQNYTRSLIGADGIMPVPEGAEVTQMDYEFYPEALEHVIRRADEEFKNAGRTDMPIMVTENGLATSDDTRRVAFIEKATDGVVACKNDGIPVIGYMYWSLMDNFEWQKGYSMTFGMIAVDRATQKRTAKPSLKFLGNL